jgi:hypothetical protein
MDIIRWVSHAVDQFARASLEGRGDSLIATMIQYAPAPRDGSTTPATTRTLGAGLSATAAGPQPARSSEER